MIGTAWESPSSNMMFVVVRQKCADVWDCLILRCDLDPTEVGKLHPRSGSGMKQRFRRLA